MKTFLIISLFFSASKCLRDRCCWARFPLLSSLIEPTDAARFREMFVGSYAEVCLHDEDDAKKISAAVMAAIFRKQEDAASFHENGGCIYLSKTRQTGRNDYFWESLCSPSMLDKFLQYLDSKLLSMRMATLHIFSHFFNFIKKNNISEKLLPKPT